MGNIIWLFPNHNPIKTGTLNSILRQTANHFGKTKEEIMEILFLGLLSP
jgi:hypothetical protein